jgi:hypothetical protein
MLAFGIKHSIIKIMMLLYMHLFSTKVRMSSHQALLLVAIYLFSDHAHAAETFLTDTLPVENNSPVIQLLAIPRADFYLNSKPATIVWKPRFELTNYISYTAKNGDSIFIDGETWEVKNRFQYQLSSNTLLAISLPWKKHTGGISDRLIYHFHDTLALPQNGRSDNHHDRLQWVITSDGKQILGLDSPVSDFGDTEIQYSWSPVNDANTQFSALLKLPTGDFDKQTGSDGFDFGVSAVKMNPDWFSHRDFFTETALAFWFGGGLGYTSEIKGLSDLQQFPVNFTLRTGLAWLVSPNWQLKLQTDSNSPIFNTDIREFGWLPIQFSMASEYTFKNNAKIDFIITEDLRPRSSPDVIVSTGLTFNF